MPDKNQNLLRIPQSNAVDKIRVNEAEISLTKPNHSALRTQIENDVFIKPRCLLQVIFVNLPLSNLPYHHPSSAKPELQIVQAKFVCVCVLSNIFHMFCFSLCYIIAIFSFFHFLFVSLFSNFLVVNSCLFFTFFIFYDCIIFLIFLILMCLCFFFVRYHRTKIDQNPKNLK